MTSDALVFSFFLIFSLAAVLATAALFGRQPLILAYIVVGGLLGPYGTALITDADLISGISRIGILFLLFLLGLDMEPGKLGRTLSQSLVVGLASSALFALAGFGVAHAFGFSLQEAGIVGITLMFSSTIIGIKLLPTTVLHHRHTGEIAVSLLLIQDLIAILVLLTIDGSFESESQGAALLQLALALPALLLACLGFVRFVLLKLLARFDAFHEYIFLIAIGWCLGVAQAAHTAGLSMEIGAFIAGISIATSPIAMYIANSLKPLRDFFLVLFFFSLGAGFKVDLLPDILLPALVLSAVVILLKPVVFRYLLRNTSETDALAWEIGFRLGQTSEFSLLIAFIASSHMLISAEASHLIQATTILSILVSSYIVIFRYPTPIAVSDSLRRN